MTSTASRRSLVLALLLVAACGESSPHTAVDASTAIDAGVDGADTDVDLGPDPLDVYRGPALLSATGLYAPDGAIAPDVLAYEVRFPLWSDGSGKGRYFAIPPGAQIDTGDPERWVFPIGTRAWKEFRVGADRIETRYFTKVAADRWDYVAYLWRADRSDADALPAGAADVLGTTHDVPDLRACNDCHRGSADGLLGVSALQLATGDADSLLTRLEARGALSVPITRSTTVPGNADTQAALGYLHGNCGHCHGEIHPLHAARALRLALPLGLTSVTDAPVIRSALGAAMNHELDGTTLGIVAGEPDTSQLWVRMQHRGDVWQMPARGSEVRDPLGSDVIRRFILGLGVPPAPTP